MCVVSCILCYDICIVSIISIRFAMLIAIGGMQF
jgi:hypothetical protein